MASTARQLHTDGDRLSPQHLARELLAQDRDAVAQARPAAPVTMLHGNAPHASATAPTRVRKPRARTKASETAPANQIQGFAPHHPRTPADTGRSTPAAAPITGQAPSLLRAASTDAPAAVAPTAPVQTVQAQPAMTSRPVSTPASRRATPRLSAASLIARAPGFVMDAGRWARHVLLGSGLAFMERVPEVLSPVAFVFANLITIAIGLAYCALPAGMGLVLLSHFPALHDAFVVSGPMKVVYMALLYVTCGFGAMVGAFALRALALGLVRTLNGFADKGKDAFADHA